MPAAEATHSLVGDPRPAWVQVLRLSWPVLVQQFLILYVGLYDQYLAGANAPEDASRHVGFQAAQTTANYIAWTVSSSSVLVAVGGTALVARFVGAGDRSTANRTLHQAILLALAVGAIATPILFAVLPGIISAMGLTGDTADSAVQFLKPIIALATFQLVAQAGIACLIAAGDTRTGPVVLSGVAVLNVPLAWSCFHGFGPIPAMGFFGIGVGTALSHAIGCVAVLAILARGRYGLKLHLGQFAPDPGLIYRLLRVGVPATIDTMSVALCQIWFLTLVTGLGDEAAAAHGTALRCEGLGYMSGQAFATAAAALVGQNLGAGRPKQAAHAGWVALGMGCLVMTAMGVLYFAFAREMLGVFSPHEHQRGVVEAGVPVLRLVAFAMPALSAIIVLTGVVRGAGDTRFPILLTWIGFLAVRLPLAYLLTRSSLDLGSLGSVPAWNLGLFGAWLAMFADLNVRGLLFLWRFVGGGWQRVKV